MGEALRKIERVQSFIQRARKKNNFPYTGGNL